MASAEQLTATEPQRPAKGGSGLVVTVTLSALFLFFMGFLNVVKSGNLFSESNFLFGALIFYAAAALYIGFGMSGLPRHASAASLMVIGGWVFNTLAAGHRWYVSGHPPFASVYEMLLCFVWTLAVLTQFAERKYGVKLIGSVTMPIAVTGVVLMQLLPSDVHPLVPALQSTWLHVHVTLAMLAYSACALSFALAMMFLIKDGLNTDTFLGVTSGFSTAIYAALVVARFARWSGGLDVVAWDFSRKEEIFLERGVRLFVTIPDLGWLFLLALCAVAAPLLLGVLGRVRRQPGLVLGANRAVFVGLLMQALALIVFITRSQSGVYPSVMAEGVYPTSLSASPFILSGIIAGIFAFLLYLMLHWRRGDLERLLPETDVLDRLTYKTVGIAFPLLTLMIATGAYWANRTWGSYWSWDPKETWALITWLVYAGYLHMRITRGWRGRRAAYFAIIGFAVVIFTFFGVTYLLPGLHAYA